MNTFEGYDAREDVFVDMVAKGIVDPTKVVRASRASKVEDQVDRAIDVKPPRRIKL
jgi:chaperonin GroEL (HSP60 family)